MFNKDDLQEALAILYIVIVFNLIFSHTFVMYLSGFATLAFFAYTVISRYMRMRNTLKFYEPHFLVQDEITINIEELMRIYKEHTNGL